MGRLYHYTSDQGHQRIIGQKLIKQSQNFQRDCVYGDGVYLTTLNPEDFDKESLAKNNYGGGWRKRLSDGRLDYYIEIEIPFSDLKLTRCEADGRDVYLYTGDLPLDNFKWQSGKISEWTYQEVLGAVVVGAAALGGIALIGKLVYDYCNNKDNEKKDAQKHKKPNSDSGRNYL